MIRFTILILLLFSTYPRPAAKVYVKCHQYHDLQAYCLDPDTGGIVKPKIAGEFKIIVEP